MQMLEQQQEQKVLFVCGSPAIKEGNTEEEEEEVEALRQRHDADQLLMRIQVNMIKDGSLYNTLRGHVSFIFWFLPVT